VGAASPLRSERRDGRSQAGRAEWFALFAIALVSAAAAWWITDARRTGAHDGEARSDLAALEKRVDALTSEVESLRAEQRTIASLWTASRGGDARDGVPTSSARSGGSKSHEADGLAAKPIVEPTAEDRAARVGNSEMARALEKVRSLPSFDQLAVDAAVAGPPRPATSSPDAKSSAKPASDDLEAAPADPAKEAAVVAKKSAEADALVVAFNRLLKDAGLGLWTMLQGEANLEDHSLVDVVLARRMERGPTTGSLSADRLVLERDPVTGAAAFVFTGARGVDGGVAVAYDHDTTRIEVPGVLPLDLLPKELADVFGIGRAQSVVDLGDVDQVVAAVNKVLVREKNVALRLRSVGKVADGKLEKAVIDLQFNDAGTAVQSVVADHAWFELDPAASYGELCCDGGEMIEKGQRRPLFRGKLRLPLRDIKPELWRGVPGTKLAAGS
jgi:hypothetical protein